MSEKRRDKKGRILKDGETQRKDGTYMYRYVDLKKERRYVYAPTLEELRSKEEKIAEDLHDGIDYAAGEITVAELVARYINLKRSLCENSRRAYSSAVNHVKDSEFGTCKIKDVKLSDAKTWFVMLHDEGMKQNTIGVIQSVLRPAFEMAVDDDMIRKNPFKFALSDVIPDDAVERVPLNKEQVERYLKYVLEAGHGHYYEDIVILLGTGLRISELYGLTKFDVDFTKRRIRIEKQLCRTGDKPYFVKAPKTKSGVRYIPMSDVVFDTFKRVMFKRAIPKVEMLVDGYSGFLFLDKNGMPKVAMHLQNFMRNLQKRYIRQHGRMLPTVTPHVLRHTFCTNAQQAGIDVKSLQYLMGHSNASVTLDVYSHSDYSSVEKAFLQIVADL